MEDYVKQIADGRVTTVEVIGQLKGLSKKTIEDFLDDLRGEAVVMHMPDFATAGNVLRSKRLIAVADAVETNLLAKRRPKTPRINKERLEKVLANLEAQGIVTRDDEGGLRWGDLPLMDLGDLMVTLCAKKILSLGGGAAWSICPQLFVNIDKSNADSARSAINQKPSHKNPTIHKCCEV